MRRRAPSPRQTFIKDHPAAFTSLKNRPRKQTVTPPKAPTVTGRRQTLKDQTRRRPRRLPDGRREIRHRGDSERRCTLGPMSETSLYPAVKRFLESAGFDVKGEVIGCDIVATRLGEPGALTIVEMKLGFSLELLLQATDRARVADEVWLAVPATRRGRDRDRRVHQLCRRLGFGLLAVSASRDRVEVLAEPGPYQPRRDQRRRARLLREHARRIGDPSSGGLSRQPIMTAYRQRALACAAMLRAGPGRPRDLRAVAPDAAGILLRNVYGWFERTGRGVYRLTEDGEAALRRWPMGALGAVSADSDLSDPPAGAPPEIALSL